MEELTIYLEDGRRVKALEGQVAALERERAALAERVRDLEFKFRCESVVNMRLIDLCREKGVKLPAGLGARPWGEEPPSS